MNTPVCLITGATSGFGKAIALRMASESVNLIITGRRAPLLNALKQQIESNYPVKVHPLSFDVRDYESTRSALENLPEDWKDIDILVNNAGLALGRGSFETGNLEDWETMIDTNVKGLMYVTRAIAPGMVQKKHGTIVNIGSIAGKEAYPGGNVYCASKFAVDALTRTMRMDFLSAGIRVAQVSPGAAETEFSLVRFKGDAEKAALVYKGFIPLSATDVADAVWYIVSRPAHVCINDLVIMPTAQASSTLIHRQNA